MKPFIAALIGLMAITALADDAEARRRFKLFGGGSSARSQDYGSKRSLPIIVPIPGASSGNIVKVRDLPDTPLFQRPDGRYVDLGYRFTSGDAGEWVGYVGSSSKYLPLSESALKGMMMVAGMSELPPPPKRGSSGGGGLMMLLGIAGLVGFFVVKKIVFGAARTATRATSAVTSASGTSQTPDWVARAEARVASGTRSPSVAAPRKSMAVASETAYSTAAPRASFGRRG